jgi:hypothetical protein
MLRSEIIDVLDKEFTYYLNKGIGVNIDGKQIMDLGEYQANRDRLEMVISACQRTDRSSFPNLSWAFGFSYDDGEISNLAPYQWSMRMQWLVTSAFRNQISENDFYHYFELCHETEDLILEACEAKRLKACGSDKFLNAANDFFNMVSKYIKDSYRGIEILDQQVVPATYRNQRVTCVFTFDKELTYAQKRKIKTCLDYKLLSYYKKFNPEIRGIGMVQGLDMCFADDGKKSKATNEFKVYIKANNWNAIGMDEPVQFVPRMGMKRMAAN